MSETGRFPFSDQDLEPDKPVPISRQQQDEFMARVRRLAGVYELSEISRVACQPTPASLSIITRGAPVSGNPGMFYATREEYVVEEEVPDREEPAERFAEYVMAPLIVNGEFDTVPVPRGVELMVPVSLSDIVSGHYAYPDLENARPVDSVMSLDPTFTESRLADAYSILDKLL